MNQPNNEQYTMLPDTDPNVEYWKSVARKVRQEADANMRLAVERGSTIAELQTVIKQLNATIIRLREQLINPTLDEALNSRIENPQQYADLKLMAAAPDLLEACETALKYIDEYLPWEHQAPMIADQLRAAIAKALPEITYPDHPETLLMASDKGVKWNAALAKQNESPISTQEELDRR